MAGYIQSKDKTMSTLVEMLKSKEEEIKSLRDENKTLTIALNDLEISHSKNVTDSTTQTLTAYTFNKGRTNAHLAHVGMSSRTTLVEHQQADRYVYDNEDLLRPFRDACFGNVLKSANVFSVQDIATGETCNRLRSISMDDISYGVDDKAIAHPSIISESKLKLDEPERVSGDDVFEHHSDDRHNTDHDSPRMDELKMEFDNEDTDSGCLRDIATVGDSERLGSLSYAYDRHVENI